jgi:hypothetical protein
MLNFASDMITNAVVELQINQGAQIQGDWILHDGTCFMQPIWRVEFWGSLLDLSKFCAPQ